MLEIPLPDLETEQLNATINLAQSLSRHNSFWPGWTVLQMFACHGESLSGTFISVTLFTRVMQSSLINFLKTVFQLIDQPLKVLINNKEHVLKQSFLKHLYNRIKQYDISFEGCKNNMVDTFNFFAPKIPVASLGLVNASSCTYCQQVFGEGDRSVLKITELYYCNQIVFNESEFTFVGDSIYVPGVRKVFHDLEYDVVVRDSQSFVHVCADKASYIPLRSLSQRVEARVQLFVLVVFICLSEIQSNGTKMHMHFYIFIVSSS